MSPGSDGLLGVAIAATRNALLDRLLPLPGVVRTLSQRTHMCRSASR